MIGLKACIVVSLAALYGRYGIGIFYAHLWWGGLRNDKIGSPKKMISIEIRRKK